MRITYKRQDTHSGLLGDTDSESVDLGERETPVATETDRDTGEDETDPDSFASEGSADALRGGNDDNDDNEDVEAVADEAGT